LITVENEVLEHPFNPIVFSDTEILILGTFPSIQSFENNFYYGHPRNQFWKIMEEISGYPIINRDQKVWLLKMCNLGLWDMISTCRRENSLDSSLENEEVNDIASLLEKYPKIRTVAFTGRKAQALFETHFGHLDVEKVYLPSPSPAYAAMTYEQKIVQYRQKLGCKKG